MSRAQSSAIEQTQASNANQATGALLPNLTAELANPGYTPAQQAAITGATEGGVGAAFGSASEAAANKAARTNNGAGLGAQNDALARERMVTSGQLGAENQETFANNAQQQQLNAQKGLQGVYGTALGGANQASAANPSFWDQFGGAFAQGLGKTLSGGFVSGGGGQPASYGFG